MPDFIRVTVKQQGLASEEFADAAFLGLTPAAVFGIGVNVGIKAVIVGPGLQPAGGRLFFREAYRYDGFGAFKTEFP